MELLFILLIVGAVFGLCYLVDKAFTKAFRGKAQHRSGLAVRASKRYGVFGVILSVFGIMGLCYGFSDRIMLFGGIFALLIGMGLIVYYLSFGIFYDGESFLYSRFGKPDKTHFYKDILGQRLYLIQGGTIVVELHFSDGSTLSLQSTMDGVYPFLDTAFAAWCTQTGRDMQSCDFHDPSNSLWFPTVE